MSDVTAFEYQDYFDLPTPVDDIGLAPLSHVKQEGELDGVEMLTVVDALREFLEKWEGVREKDGNEYVEHIIKFFQKLGGDETQIYRIMRVLEDGTLQPT